MRGKTVSHKARIKVIKDLEDIRLKRYRLEEIETRLLTLLKKDYWTVEDVKFLKGLENEK